jgi:hypothetical protein
MLVIPGTKAEAGIASAFGSVVSSRDDGIK